MRKHLFKQALSICKTAAFATLAAITLLSCEQKKQVGTAQPAEFAVMKLTPSSITLKNTYPAIIRGMQDIEIRPQVSGFIPQLLVDEGSTVKAGQRLFTIDPIPYEAALKMAEANLKVARTAVATSRLTYNNKKTLYSKNIISHYELQMADNALAISEAQAAQMEAQLLNAKNNLSYTRIVSPSNGVIGSIPFRVGSLVTASTPTPLTVVSNIDKMFVYFSMTEKQLLELTRQGGSMQQILDNMPAVDLQLIDGSMYADKGKIETVSGVIEQATGAVSMRATFPNDKNLLRSGGTGAVQLPSIQNNVLMIPQAATYEIQDKRFVYRLQNDGTIKVTEITVFSLDNGESFIVTSGLKAGDEIVSEGIVSLRDGMTITPKQN